MSTAPRILAVAGTVVLVIVTLFWFTSSGGSSVTIAVLPVQPLHARIESTLGSPESTVFRAPTASKPVKQSKPTSPPLTRPTQPLNRTKATLRVLRPGASTVAPPQISSSQLSINNLVKASSVSGKNCSINPALLIEMGGPMLPECESASNGVVETPSVAWPNHAYLISMPDKIPDYHARKQFLRAFGINLIRWPAVIGAKTFDTSEYSTMTDRTTNKTFRVWNDRATKQVRHEGWNDGFLTLGERGYLASMRGLFEQGLRNKEIRSMMIFDEDVLFDCHFKEELLAVLQSSRCGGPVSRNAAHGGVLVLGASIWVEKWRPGELKGWALSNHDLVSATSQFHTRPMCFNAHSKVFGSYAVIYHRSTFAFILEWIKRTRVPFDHIFKDLSMYGHVVRVAYPFVAIQDVAHNSTIDNRGTQQANLEGRARLHHWQLDRYCYPDFRPVLSVIQKH